MITKAEIEAALDAAEPQWRTYGEHSMKQRQTRMKNALEAAAKARKPPLSVSAQALVNGTIPLSVIEGWEESPVCDRYKPKE